MDWVEKVDARQGNVLCCVDRCDRRRGAKDVVWES